MSPFSKLFLAFVLCLPLVGYGAYRNIASIMWDRNVGGHLKRAGDANSLQLAQQELEVALKYLDENNIKTGYTSVFWTTPDEDIAFWHTNLATCVAQIKALPDNTSQGEKDMLLLKLRETLLDHHGGKESVTQPDGISIYPHNTLMAGVFAVSAVLATLGIILFSIGMVQLEGRKG